MSHTSHMPAILGSALVDEHYEWKYVVSKIMQKQANKDVFS